MKSLNSLFSLTPRQFKVIYISWTVLAILFGGIYGAVIYTTFDESSLRKLLSGELAFTAFSIRSLFIETLTLFLTINIVLFYIALYHKNRVVTTLLNWLPIFVVIMFTYFVVKTRHSITGMFIILVPYFIFSYCIIWIKQGEHFEMLETKRGIRDENLNS